MKKFIFLMMGLLCFSATAAELVNYREFIRMTDEQKVETIIAYKKFLSEQTMPLGEDKSVGQMISFISEAFAAAGEDCFFAGWPSKVRTSGGRQFCTSPANANPDYQSQAATCSGSQLLCNPVLFGDVGCIAAGTQAQKNLAFSTCEQKFKSSGKTVAQIAASLSDPAKRTSAEAMFATASKVCGAGGFQASKPMCRNLSAKVSAIRGAAPAVAAAAPEREAPADRPTTTTGSSQGGGAAGETTTSGSAQGGSTTGTSGAGARTGDGAGGIGLAVDVLSRDPREVLHPGSENCTEEEHNHQRPEAPVRAVAPARPQDIKKVVCAPASTADVPQTREALMAELAAGGVEAVPTEIPDEHLGSLKSFVAEYRKFPASLLQSMKGRGGKIHIMVGEGVTVDPSFKGTDDTPQQQFRKRELASVGNTTDEWKWSKTPGSGGSIAPSYQKEPTRIVINNLYKRHGSSNLFLHEHAHMLDSFAGLNSISGSSLWNSVINGPGKDNIGKLMQVIHPTEVGEQTYLTNFKGEGFAELFSYYFACAESKDQVKQVAPELAAFFDSMTSLDALRARMNSSSIVYIYRRR